MTLGWQGAQYSRRHRRELAGFKTGDFVKEKLGGGYRKTTPVQNIAASRAAVSAVSNTEIPRERAVSAVRNNGEHSQFKLAVKIKASPLKALTV